MIKVIHFILLIIVVPFFLQAQHQVRNGVIGNGATNSASASNQIRGTVGQAAIGSANSETLTLNSGFWVGTFELVTQVDENHTTTIPTEFKLQQNYPNPFNPGTTITFAVPRASNVTIKLFDVLGRRVATLLDKNMNPGEHKLYFDASGLASGMYLYRLEAEGVSQTRKLMLLK